MSGKFNLWERDRVYTPDSALTDMSVQRIARDIKQSLGSLLQSPTFTAEYGTPLGELVGTPNTELIAEQVCSRVLSVVRECIAARSMLLHVDVADDVKIVLVNRTDYPTPRIEPDLTKLTTDHTCEGEVVAVTLMYMGRPVRVELDAQ